ncbi:hypothetical protein [Halocola ammonii]
MKRYTTKRKLRFIVAFFICLFLSQIATPTVSFALTSGPSQPEFSSFEPVATTNMVNEFTGDLTYNLPVLNIPGADGGGYSMSLSYHSGASIEEEASWVGYGWTLNPGAINRQKRGYPDDWRAENVIQYSKSKASRTFSVGVSNQFELFSWETPLNGSAAIRYNNYKGFGYSVGASYGFGNGVASLGFNLSDGQGSFSLNVNPARLANNLYSEAKAKQANLKEEHWGRLFKFYEKKSFTANDFRNASAFSSGYSVFQNYGQGKPNFNAKYNGGSYRFGVSVMPTAAPPQVGPDYTLFGTYAWQKNESQTTAQAYGYMYSRDGEKERGDNTLMDYFKEHEAPFEKRDKFLSIPYANPDNFAVSGEGISGAFKLRHKEVGHFYPNKVTSKVHHVGLGLEVEAGLNFGGGGNASYGQHTLSTEPWVDNSYGHFSNPASHIDQDAVSFRFANDMGGKVSYGADEQEETASIDGSGGDRDALAHQYNNSGRPGHSSFIHYALNKNFSEYNYSGVVPQVYERSTDVGQDINRSSGDHIGEFGIHNESGDLYVYGYPLHNKADESMSYGVKGLSDAAVPADLKYVSSSQARSDNVNNIEQVIGEKTSAAYPSTYLLTQITTPDYIDVNQDGPTDDDFGGWTKFSYDKKYGYNGTESSSYYKWRAPYEGFGFQRGEISNPDDDLASVQLGHKEVAYLDEIETKTHVAKFHTSQRTDGRSAIESEEDAGNLYDSNDLADTKALYKLDSISLRTKDGDRLVKTIHFEYDNSLCPGLPNSTTGQGKLTLKKVWFEHNGVVRSEIAPYEFVYEYPDFEYPYYNEGANGEKIDLNAGLTELNENPLYSPYNADAWGNYQKNGLARHTEMRPWLDQSEPDSGFDPAAWQLKQIKLPSGGEIHIQYEQDDYRYVQDQIAHSMVPLKENPQIFNAEVISHRSEFLLNLGEIDTYSSNELESIRQAIYNRYVKGDERIYFKILYRLQGLVNPTLTDCKAEYISGYAEVKEVTIDDGDIKLKLHNGEDDRGLPMQVCKDFVKTNRAGNMPVIDNGECQPNSYLNSDGLMGSSSEIVSFVYELLNMAAIQYGVGATCLRYDPAHSYFRIPVLRQKRGGGIRVKRLLMYDDGTRTDGQPVVYGSEYEYKSTRKVNGEYVSSGVATNEPQSIREENILVGFLSRFNQNFLQKAVAGRDKRQSEGPIGGAAMPGPSVGYSRVVVKNIHSGKTNTGYKVLEFNTAKDYPFKFESTDVVEETQYIPIPTGIVNIFKNKSWATQGFNFYQNNMHGQVKSMANYAGDYSLIHEEGAQLISKEETHYFEPGEEVPVVTRLNPTLEEGEYFETSPMQIGKEVEVAMEARGTEDKNNEGAIYPDVDAGIAVVGLIPFISALASATLTDVATYTHVTSKVISYPAVVKSKTITQNGVQHTTLNEAFDKNTGQPIITKTFDGYRPYEDNPDLAMAQSDLLDLESSSNHEGIYTNYNIPASLVYPEMGQKGYNQGTVISTHLTSVFETDVEVNFKSSPDFHLEFEPLVDGVDVCSLMDKLTPGDLVEVYFINEEDHVLPDGQPADFEIYEQVANTLIDQADRNVFHVTGSQSNQVLLETVSYTDMSNLNDDTGVFVRVLRSGKTNQLNASVASYTTYMKNDQPTGFTFSQGGDFSNREQFAALLNDLINNGSPGSKVAIPNSLVDLVMPGEPCGFQVNEEYSLMIDYDGDLIVVTDGTGQAPLGTPSNPHPMVTALNDYLSEYYRYDLSGIGGKPSHCQYPINGALSFVDVSNSESTVSSMRTAQQGDLNQTFSFVNGNPIPTPISNYFVDDGFGLGNTEVLWSTQNQSKENMRVLLKEVGTNYVFGVRTRCDIPPKMCFGCSDSQGGMYCETAVVIKDKFGDYTIEDAPIGGFEQLNDGSLVYVYDDYSGNGEKIQCETGIKFWREGTTDVEVCELVPSSASGSFVVNPMNGLLEFVDDEYSCNPIVMDCIQFCDNAYPKLIMKDVVSSQVTTMDDNWYYDLDDYFCNLSGDSKYESGKKGKWRQKSTYAYEETVDGLDGVATAGRSYNSGMYDTEVFLFETGGLSEKWLKLNTVTSYSPNGSALEEENILGIKSAAKFGYDKMLPTLVAQNASANTVFFESFEKVYPTSTGDYFEDGMPSDGTTWVQDSDDSHSGQFGAKLSASAPPALINHLAVNNQVLDQGINFKVWVKVDEKDPDEIAASFDLSISESGNSVASKSLTYLSRSGEWALFSCDLNPEDIVTLSDGDQVSMYLDFSHSWISDIVLDDLRVQPKDAQVVTYVYNADELRLVASFDDQHFGLFYQYNQEGKLIRKTIETERGRKTLKETYYHIPRNMERPVFQQ